MPHESTTRRRLFIAVDLPDDVKRPLARLVRVPPAGVRVVAPEQMHLTLHFLGSVEEGSAMGLAEALRGVRPETFTIDVGGVGCFPPHRRPAVLWAGVQPSQPLASLHAAIGDVIKARRLAVDDRPFHPHVTLARLSPRLQQRWIADFLAGNADLFVAGIPVAAFILFESQRTDGGHEHIRVETYPLGS